MKRNNITVVISLPITLIHKIEKRRGDLPRSLIYRRLLTKAIGEDIE